MGIKDYIKNLWAKNDDEKTYQYKVEDENLVFYLEEDLFEKAENNEASPLIFQQHIMLKTIADEGVATQFGNKFFIETKDVLNFDENFMALFKLPQKWNGKIELDIKGNAISGYNGYTIKFTATAQPTVSFYKLNGPFLEFTEELKFLLSPVLFNAIKKHSEFTEKQKQNAKIEDCEYYHLFSAFQQAQKKNENILLGHLDNGFNIIPDFSEDFQTGTGIGVALDIKEDGSGELIPTFKGSNSTVDDIKLRLGQLEQNKSLNKTLRVNKEVILINPQRQEAIDEIKKVGKLLKPQVEEFLKCPTAFISADKVDLENGFSARVVGVSEFKPAYFSDVNDSGIKWIEEQEVLENSLIGLIEENKEDLEKLEDIEEAIDFAIENEETKVIVDSQNFSMDDLIELFEMKKLITKYKRKYLNSSTQYDENKEDKQPVKLILETITNDEILEFSHEIDRFIESITFKEFLNLENVKRRPFSHQEIGIRWILGLINKKYSGGLLADDMGLGKTFTTLCAIEQTKQKELFKNSNKPTLIVAPLSLLENWKDEVEKTFYKPPFSDIVILNGDGLKSFKINLKSKVEIKNQEQNAIGDENKIRYSLKLGNQFGTERLDKENRLIITTYQTLRDYQFSLCRIEWNFVIFDEAQNIKNPNVLQTKAAKALNSDFNLMVTGTPVENSLKDFWCLIDTALPGELLGSYQDFNKEFIRPIAQAKEDRQVVQYQKGKELRRKIGYFMLRRNKEDNLEGLPTKTLYSGIENDNLAQYIEQLSSIMDGRQKEIYETIIKQANEKQGQGKVLASIQKLRRVSLHPNLCEKKEFDFNNLNETISLSKKLESLILILEEIKKRDEKVIIFCLTKQLQIFLKGALTKYFNLKNVSVINGDTKAVSKGNTNIKSRKELILEFEQKEGFNIIIMSPIAAGVGLTVVGANNVIHLERHWNPAKEAQATDRVYRIGQTKSVNVYFPILKHPRYDSFDVSLHKLLLNKTLLSEAVVTTEDVDPKVLLNQVSM